MYRLLYVFRQCNFARDSEVALILKPLWYGSSDNGKDTGFFLYATSNIERTSLGFAPRTAIDGDLENSAHVLAKRAFCKNGWSNIRHVRQVSLQINYV